jgi:FixJ family two-component response regulator
MSDATPIVFVVDDDVSVRESLELLIRYERLAKFWVKFSPE